jgi:hypothetical protein
MKYNRAFIAAVHNAAVNDGNGAAEAIFNKLFDINGAPAQVQVMPEAVKAPSELMTELRQKIGAWVYHSDIRNTNDEVGVPGMNAVVWIKNFRERTNFGLKQCKDAYDFVRDNPTILD